MMKENTLRMLFSLLIVLFASRSYALTICGFGCSPSNYLPGVDPVSTGEVFSFGNGVIDFSMRDGLVILDSEIFNFHPNLTIDPGTDIYFGLTDVPSGVVVPEFLQVGVLFDATNASLTGLVGLEYMLVRQVSNTDIISITASQGVLVLDVDALVVPAVPVPAAVWLFASGFSSLLLIGRRRNKRI